MITRPPRSFLRHRLPVLLAAAGLTAALAACSSSQAATTAPATAAGAGATTAASPAAGDPDLSGVTLRVGETGWQTQTLLLAQAGLGDTPYTVEPSTFQGGNLQLEALGAGAIDLASASEIPPIFAAQTGGVGTLSTVAVRKGTTLTQEVVVPEGSDITSVAQLEGRSVAYVQNTTAHYFLYESLKEAGLSWSDITPVPLSTSDGLAALLSGQVDALASYGNAIISAHSKGATTLVDAKDLLSGNFLYLTVPAVLADAGKKAAIVDYFGRLQQGYAWAREHPQEWAETIAEQTKQPVEQALKTFTDGEAQRPSSFTTVTPEAIASEQKVLDTFVEAGILPAEFDIAPFWTDELNGDLARIEAGDVG